jgi:hypothetical protein
MAECPPTKLTCWTVGSMSAVEGESGRRRSITSDERLSVSVEEMKADALKSNRDSEIHPVVICAALSVCGVEASDAVPTRRLSMRSCGICRNSERFETSRC